MPAARPVPAATRRAALVAGGTALGLVGAGCGQQVRPDPSAQSAASAPEQDDAILDSVRSELAAAVALVAATRQQHRPLRARLADLEAAHVTQLGVLDPDAETAIPSSPEVPRDADTALARLSTSEQRLQRRLLTWAVAADSGPLARVLAAASAGTAQHLATLSEGGTT